VTDNLGADGIRLERESSIGWLYIDRPHARNAFTPAMYWGIKKAVHLVNSDPDLAALIITGTGDVFAPGGDLGGRSDPGDEPSPRIGAAAKEVLMTPPMTRMLVKRMLNEQYGFVDYQTMFWALEESPEPREGMLAFMEKRSPNWVPKEFAKGNGPL
jgi:enoyl-CoA hydratase/carnithine racemase